MNLVIFKEKISNIPLNYSLKKVYKEFFEILQKRNFKIYVTESANNYFDNNLFRVSWVYEKLILKKISKFVIADVILDKSTKLCFPTYNTKNCINSLDFKVFEKNKWQTYIRLKKFSPKSVLIKQIQTDKIKLDLLKILKTSKIVIKPLYGMRGEGIILLNKSLLKTFNISKLKENDYIAQEFVDTSKGIEGIVKEHHDLRFIVSGRKIVEIFLRIPIISKTNISVVGEDAYRNIKLARFPSTLLNQVKKIIEEINKSYKNQFFTVDIGVENNKVMLFELNGTIGFPDEHINYQKFIKALADRITMI